MKNLRKFNESNSAKSKCLYVSGGDFSALSFQEEYSGTKVSDIIENLSDYESEEWDLEVYEFGEVDPEFVEFVRDTVQDYDQKKDATFFFDWETLDKK